VGEHLQVATLPDAVLVDRVRAGDEEAFGGLLQRYQGKVYRLAMHLTRNPQDAEEVTQDVFLAVYRKLRDFEDRASFRTWLYRIASNAALMKLRRRRPVVPLAGGMEGPAFREDGQFAQAVADWSAYPEAELLAAERRSVLEQAIVTLSPDDQAVVVLRDIEGLSNQEVAEILGTTLLAVKSRLHRARLALRERLAAYFGAGRAGGGAATFAG
jgi:RNA polymerase sigma-70 factor (ECF subfamily)